MRPRVRFALIGVLLGFGAPLGSLTWRLLTQSFDSLTSLLIQELQSATYYYLYMAIGTVTAFGIFGYLLGLKNEGLSDLSITDGLTGIYNHRYLQEQLSREIERSNRYLTPVTCLMLDIDDFKQVNDQHGHLMGDEVLKSTVQMIRAALRQTDIIGRYGGEEFLVIMPQTARDAALPLAERILTAVQSQPFEGEDTVFHVTVSIGLATYPDLAQGIKNQSSLLSAADQAMYRAKLKGKNQVVTWSQLEKPVSWTK